MVFLLGGVFSFGASSVMAKPTSSSTVAIYNHKTDTLCSGVLISEKAVLTAPQCLESRDAVVVFGKDLALALATDVNHKKNTRNIVKVEWAPHYSSQRIFERGVKNAGLLALVFLDSRAPAGYEPQAFAQTNTKISRGETLTMAGFGSENATRLYQASVRIEDDKYSLTEFLISHKPTPASSCPGEAGSPLMKGPSGQRVVVGIMAYRKSTHPCHRVAIVTKIAPYRTWIDRKLK